MQTHHWKWMAPTDFERTFCDVCSLLTTHLCHVSVNEHVHLSGLPWGDLVNAEVWQQPQDYFMAAAGVSVGRDANKPSFPEIQACCQPKWAVCTPRLFSVSDIPYGDLNPPDFLDSSYVWSDLHCPFVGQDSRSCIFERGSPFGITCPKLPSFLSMLYR